MSIRQPRLRACSACWSRSSSGSPRSKPPHSTTQRSLDMPVHGRLQHFRSRASLSLAVAFVASACARSSTMTSSGNVGPTPMGAAVSSSVSAPSPDPRVGLKAGLYDAGTAAWNLRLVSTTKPEGKFEGTTNSDLAFLGNYVIQGNYNGYQIWDISN